jgi:hypothetical protein
MILAGVIAEEKPSGGGGGGGGVALLVHTAAAETGYGSGFVTTPAIDTTGANFLAVIGQSDDPSTGVLTDSYGNTWTQATAGSSSVPVVYYCSSPIVGPGHTFTMTHSGGFTAALAVGAFSGVHASPFESVVNAPNRSGPTSQPGILAPSVGDLAITGIAGAHPLVVVGSSIDSDFTITDAVDGGGFSESHVAMAYLIVTGASGETPQAWNSGTTYTVGAIVSYLGNNYVALYAGTGHNPIGTGYWGAASPGVAPLWTIGDSSSLASTMATFAKA